MVISFSCALLSISLQQWARRYIRLTQPARRSPEKRARIRAFYANGVDKMQVPWAVEGLPTLLHLSLFLFFIGLVIFLFNIDQEVFTSVAWWIGLFSMLYGLITLLPVIRPDSPYYTPLSILIWFLYSMLSIFFRFLAGFAVVLAFLPKILYYRGRVVILPGALNDYKVRLTRVLGGVENMVENMTEKLSLEMDIRIFGWTLAACALGDDDSLEEFFEAIPGLFDTNLVDNLKNNLPKKLLMMFWDVLNSFMGRTLSSNSVTEQVKSHREAICRDIMRKIPCTTHPMPVNLESYRFHAPVSIETVQATARWSDACFPLTFCPVATMEFGDSPQWPATRPSRNATLPRLRARGLVNTGSMCFVNAVLQLLVHSPPFWDLLRELDDLKERRRAVGLETGGGITPMADSTLRFFEESMFTEPPRPQQQLQLASEGLPNEDEEAKEEHESVDPFEPTYLYDAMKEKRQLNNLLVRFMTGMRLYY